MAALLVAGCRSDGSREAFCERVLDVPVIRDADTLVEPGGEELLAELLAALQQLRDASPGEVRPDLNTLVSVTEDLQRVLAEGDLESADAEVLAELRSGVVYYGAASERVVAYADRTCGIDLTNVTPAPTVTTTTRG